MDMIIMDDDGDLWVSVAPDKWECRTEDTDPRTIEMLRDFFGPLVMFERV